MKKTMLVFVVAAMLSGCAGAEETRGGGPQTGTPDGATRVPISAVPCRGCVGLDGACVDGTALDSCGTSGGACDVCSFGETCDHGACAVVPSACIKMMSDAGLGDPCSADDECCALEWCAEACCDPVSHVCFAVGMCAAKRGHGEHCDYDNGDRQCLSGVCDPLTDACL